MSDILKCPYCGGILEQSSIFKLNSYACTDLACKGYYMTATKDMWQELIRTRKALDVAVDALKDNLSQANFTQMLDASRFHCIRTKCESALEQITALEQKDV